MNPAADSTRDLELDEVIHVGFVGVGQLAEYMVSGFCTSDRPPVITLSPRSRERAELLASRFSLSIARSNQEATDAADVIVLAVPPGDTVAVARSIDFRAGQLVICVAAGVPLRPVADAVAPANAVRAMPPTSVGIRQGATVLFPSDTTAVDLLSRLGSVHPFETETDFETATVIVTYYGWIYALMSEVSAWLETKGVDQAYARPLVAQMTRSACSMCLEGGADMSEEARRIGRPGTYTGLGLDLLERMDALSAWSETLDAVLETTRRGSTD